ncbi:MAG TPA: membrane dipeptidase [Tepidisphaeraceae bacterium]|nr:membrane dipeptidase [Tepidisphaeraceae bacterium]
MRSDSLLIVDAHLDLAYNALRGRNVLLPAREQTADDEGIPTVGFPDVRAGGVGLICATVFCQPDSPRASGYKTAQEAHVMAWQQMQWYQRQVEAQVFDFVRGSGNLPVSSTSPEGGQNTQGQIAQATVKAILLLEGADALRTVQDVQPWFDAGLRIVGLAWKRTRYAGGTGAPGPLTADGVALVKALDALGIIHDTSHLAEESFWQLLDLSDGPVIASHSNCRALVPTDRQLSDEMIKALIARGGVIGMNFYDKFLLPPEEYGKRRATLADVVRHVKHITDLAGSANHVALGTDMDGGLGREQIPQEITTSADLPRVADALSAGGFSDDDVCKIMGRNWVAFFQRSLPR